MKKNDNNRNKTHSNQSNKNGHKYGRSDDLEKIAEELEELARRRLPDSVLHGVLKGYEQDIRQEAVIMALSWYLRGDFSSPGNMEREWQAQRAIAGALRIIKRDYVRFLKGEAEALLEMIPNEDATTRHPVMIPPCDWPASTMRKLTERAIRIARKREKISSLHAAIAIEVLVDGVQVAEIAKRRNVHRSSIYQHLSRVRHHLANIIESIEVPLQELN